MRTIVNGENTLRTMTLWNDPKLLEARIDKIRAKTGEAVGMSGIGDMAGSLAVEPD